jgi:hypothetical protein
MDHFGEDDQRHSTTAISALYSQNFPHFAFDSITFFAKDGKQKAAE